MKGPETGSLQGIEEASEYLRRASGDGKPLLLRYVLRRIDLV